MNTEQLNRFKSLLSVPSKTYKEEKMVEYICSELENLPGVSFYRDEVQNIYITKGELMDGEFYPMFIAHTDTVHDTRQHRRRNPEAFKQAFVPGPGMDVEQQGACRVARIRQMQSSTGEMPDQPAVDGSEREFTALGPFAGARHMIQEPGQFGR